LSSALVGERIDLVGFVLVLRSVFGAVRCDADEVIDSGSKSEVPPVLHPLDQHALRALPSKTSATTTRAASLQAVSTAGQGENTSVRTHQSVNTMASSANTGFDAKDDPEESVDLGSYS
jgi:hypothetical protein